jgi:hypothetical protein
MKIERKAAYDHPEFKSIKHGDLFRIGNTYFMKICETTNQRNVVYNAVEIESGIPTHVSDNEEVEPLNAKVVIE